MCLFLPVTLLSHYFSLSFVDLQRESCLHVCHSLFPLFLSPSHSQICNESSVCVSVCLLVTLSSFYFSIPVSFADLQREFCLCVCLSLSVTLSFPLFFYPCLIPRSTTRPGSKSIWPSFPLWSRFNRLASSWRRSKYLIPTSNPTAQKTKERMIKSTSSEQQQ